MDQEHTRAGCNLIMHNLAVGSRPRGNPSVASLLGYTAQQHLHANLEADRAPGLPHCGKPGQEQKIGFLTIVTMVCISMGVCSGEKVRNARDGAHHHHHHSHPGSHGFHGFGARHYPPPLIIEEASRIHMGVCSGEKVRNARDGAHHHHHHSHPGSHGFHGFGARHYPPPLIIEEASRIQGQHNGGYGYTAPSVSYGPPAPHIPTFHDYDGIDSRGVCPVGCVPQESRFIGGSPCGKPSTHYGPPLPIYANHGNHYVEEEEEEEEEETPVKPTPKPPKPTRPPKPTTEKPPKTNTLPPSIDEETVELAKNFGFLIVPGDGKPADQAKVDRVLALLPEGLSFSLVPMDIQDAFFAGQIDIVPLDEEEKRKSRSSPEESFSKVFTGRSRDQHLYPAL
ncbi:unnamed protein product [Notodromas monacha]|uniref:Uncharacterized protein n=1 Tax=Notodromas monacha TaxID=399045 RepID=A0A7R9GGH8_9CRUS|nr:unnamed protein product [Notodromas monacha]CAG0921723.1 unnamed protein product [Notodromas monacha]